MEEEQEDVPRTRMIRHLAVQIHYSYPTPHDLFSLWISPLACNAIFRTRESVLAHRQLRWSCLFPEHDLFSPLGDGAKMRLDLVVPELGCQTENDSKDGQSNDLYKGSGQWMSHHHNHLGALFLQRNGIQHRNRFRPFLFHRDQRLTREEEPGEHGAHCGAVKQVYWERDFAKPEEDGQRKEPAQLRRAKDGEAEQLGADGGPESHQLRAHRRKLGVESEHEERPVRPMRTFGGKRHHEEGEEGKREEEDAREA